MLREAKFVPLDKINFKSNPELEIKVNLPDYVPTNEIGLNVTRIKFLSRMAGLKYLKIDTASDETSSEQFNPTSIDGQGNATGNITVAHIKSPLFKTDLDRDKSLISRLYPEYSWSDGQITINSSELNKRTYDAARKENGPRLRDPDEWANLLNESITTGLTTSARLNLLKNPTIMSKIWLGLTIFESISLSNWLLSDSSIPNNLADFIFKFSYFSVMNQLISTTSTAVQFRDRNIFKERRLSLIPAYQLDRLFLVNAIAKSSKIVKVIKPEK